MKLLTRELLAQIDSLQIPSKRRTRAQQRGEKSSRRKGSSIEFSDYREYLQGDDIRSIDWNVYARSERLFLKLFLEEESKNVTFIVDSSQSMNFGSPSKFDYALALASALSYVCLRRYDRPKILLLKDQTFRPFRFGSQRQFFTVTAHLDKQQPGGETHLSSALKKIAVAGFPRGIYFIISDFYSYDGFDGMKILAAAGNELHCLQVLTDDEAAPSIRGDWKLLDSETTDKAEVSITPHILKRYLARLAGLQHQLQLACRQSFSTFQPVRTSQTLESLLLRDLRRSGVLN